MRLLKSATTSTSGSGYSGASTAASSPLSLGEGAVVSLKIHRKRKSDSLFADMYYRAVVSRSCETWDMLVEYSDCKVVGKGSYGEVVCARLGSATVAIKRVEILEDNLCTDWENGLRLLREIYFLRSVRHPNLASLLTLFPNNPSSGGLFRQIYLVSEYYKEGSLSSFSPSSVGEIMSIHTQLVSGLAYLHAHKVVHRDVKRENIFVKKVGKKIHIVLGDFGLTRTLSNTSMTCEVVTKPYRCPSLLFGETRYGGEIDVFAAGLCLMEMLLGRPDSTILPNRKIGLANFVKHQLAICGPPRMKVESTRIGQLAAAMHLNLAELVDDCLTENNMNFDDRMVQEWKLQLLRDIEANLAPKTLSKAAKETAAKLKSVCFRMIKFNPEERITAQDALGMEEKESTTDLLSESFDSAIRPLNSDEERGLAVKKEIWKFVQNNGFGAKLPMGLTEVFPDEEAPVAKRTRSRSSPHTPL